MLEGPVLFYLVKLGWLDFHGDGISVHFMYVQLLLLSLCLDADLISKSKDEIGGFTEPLQMKSNDIELRAQKLISTSLDN